MLDIGSVSHDTTQEDTDYTGGGSFVWETDVHDVKVTLCYGIKKPSGSMCLHFEFENAAGKKYKEDCYFLSSKGRIDYDMKKDGKVTGQTKHIPGFTRCANIVACAFSDDYAKYVADEANGPTLVKRHENFFQGALSSMERKTVPVMDWDLKKEVNQEVDHVMTKLHGRTLKLGISKNLENKSTKDESGTYVPNAETRETNEISIEFDNNRFSSMELRGKIAEPASHDAWLKNNQGKTNDKRTIKDGSPDPAGATGSTPETKTGDDIFGNGPF